MTVYNDMANDAGYGYDSQENEQMANMLEAEERAGWERHWAEQEEMYARREVLFRTFEL